MKSKFSYLHVYLTSVFLLSFLIISIYLFVHPEIQLKTKFGATISGSIGGIIFILFGCFLFHSTFKNIFKLRIENQTINIKNKASITLFTVDDSWTFGKEHILSKSKNSAFLGYTMKGKAIGIYNQGKLVLS